mgnify:CR=1 FL=1
MENFRLPCWLLLSVFVCCVGEQFDVSLSLGLKNTIHVFDRQISIIKLLFFFADAFMSSSFSTKTYLVTLGIRNVVDFVWLLTFSVSVFVCTGVDIIVSVVFFAIAKLTFSSTFRLKLFKVLKFWFVDVIGTFVNGAGVTIILLFQTKFVSSFVIFSFLDLLFLTNKNRPF